MDNIFADRGGDETAENDCGHGIHNLLAGLLAAKDQRDETEGRHEYGGEAFEAASQNHRFGELFALLLHQVQVMSDQQDAISRRDATERDETDTGPGVDDCCFGSGLRAEPQPKADGGRSEQQSETKGGPEAQSPLLSKHERDEERQAQRHEDQRLARELRQLAEIVVFLPNGEDRHDARDGKREQQCSQPR